MVANLQPLVPSYALTTKKAWVLSAARADQFAGPLPGKNRPANSYLLLGALRGWGDINDNGEVTVTEAAEYAKEVMQATLRDRIQEPEMTRGGFDVVLGKGREKGPDMVELAIEMHTGQAAIIGNDEDILGDVDAITA